MTQEKRRPVTSGAAPEQSTATTKAIMTRGRGVWSQLELWQQATPPQRRELADAVIGAHRAAATARQLVMAYPDLREQLVRRIGYSRPDQWTGYIPPRFYDAGGDHLRWVFNDSPVREVLVELVAEAEARGVA